MGCCLQLIEGAGYSEISAYTYLAVPCNNPEGWTFVFREVATCPVWSNTSQSNYRHIQILQSKCLRVIGDYARRTPIYYLHSTLSLEYIHTFIYRLTEKFFQQCTTHCNPLISQIGNYSVLDLLAQYRKYTHKRTKHLL